MPKADTRPTPRQRKAIVALLSAKDTKAAAILAGVAPRTLYRWFTEDTFRAALLSAEGAAIDAAARLLIANSDQAVGTLVGLCREARSEAVKRQAADSILAHLLKLRELRNVEERITRLEEAVLNGKHR